MPSSHLILWCPFVSLPSIFPSTKDFSYESAVHIRWSKYWSFQLQHQLNGYSGLISLKVHWFWSPCYPRDFQEFSPAPQFEGINSLVFCLLYIPALTTTGKTIALTTWTFVGRLMSLLFNTLSRFVIAFLPRINCLLISWLQSSSSDFRAQEEEICHYFHLFPFCLPWGNGARCHDLSIFNI